VQPARIAATSIGCLILAGAIFSTLSAALPQPNQVMVLAASLSPWTIPAFLIALMALWFGRPRRWLTWSASLIAVAGLVLNLIWILPSFREPDPKPQADLRIIQLNTNRGRVDPEQVRTLLKKTRPDVFVMAEATSDFLKKINANGSVGPGGIVPEYAEVPSGEMLGVVTYSRYPITFEKSAQVSDGAYQFRVEAPTPFTLIALHPAEPLVAYGNWKSDFANIIELTREAPDPKVVVGDFNVTARNEPMRALLSMGLRDAAVEAGSGWQPTWPAQFGVFTALTLDHVLFSREFAAATTATVSISGGDHLALVADLRMPA
jgi:endonuclease/exonuclease/phosphatase (EEP) superfamily protein YafD